MQSEKWRKMEKRRKMKVNDFGYLKNKYKKVHRKSQFNLKILNERNRSLRQKRPITISYTLV